VKDFNAVITDGLKAGVSHSRGRTAKQVCEHYFRVARENATEEERKYLWIIQKRIEEGSLSETIKKSVQRKAQKTDLKEAVISVYLNLIKNLMNNKPYP
jgi:site-specific recombinase XerD